MPTLHTLNITRCTILIGKQNIHGKHSDYSITSESENNNTKKYRFTWSIWSGTYSNKEIDNLLF